MKTISLINMKGGVGKTTLAINIAHFIAKIKNKRVLFLDVDPQFNATQCLMNTQSYIEHLKKNKDTILTVFDNNITTKVSTIDGSQLKERKDLSAIQSIEIMENLYLLPGNLNLYQLEMAAGEGREHRLCNFLSKNKDKYDYVIIDTPPTPSVWLTSALIGSDFYLIAVKPDPLSMTGIDLLNAIVKNRKENYALSIQCAGLVMNMVEKNTKVFNDATEFIQKSERWKRLKYNNYIPKRTNIAREQTSNHFILDLDDEGCKISLSGIVTELMERIDD